jgi:4-oxalocrotonate tautomerase
MPLVQVTMIEGRSAEAKANLIRRVTDAIVETTQAPRDSVRVIIQEVPGSHWGVGGVPKGASHIGAKK